MNRATSLPASRAASAVTANAAETARRVLKTLAERRIIPTPESFSEVYHEVSGTRPGPGATPVAILREVLKDLVRTNRLAPQEAAPVVERAQMHDWASVRDALDRALARRPGGAAGNWPQTALQLLKQTDLVHANWTRARKIDAVTRVIEGAADQPDVALERLARLMKSWGPVTGAPAPRDAPVPPPAAADGAPAAAAQESARGETDAWRQVALRAMRLLEHSCGAGTPAALKLRDFANAADRGAIDTERLLARFLDAVREIDRQIDEEHKVRIGLQRLLALLCNNMNTLTPEEAWLAGQLEPIRALLAGTIRSAALDEAEAKLTQVIAQQAAARKSLQEAKAALKEMLGTLVERIGEMSNYTGHFFDRVGTYQHQLESAQDFETLSAVIRGLLDETRTVRGEIKRSRDELAEAKRKVETYEARVRQLEKELTQVSSLVQKDPLTFALNRRGLDEAFRMETARALRHGSPLTFVIVDLDDFKRLNDSLGHIAGDRALVHFSTLMQAAVRPTDFIARLGGEEFALLLPATDVGEAVAATERLQRELRKRGFQFEGQAWTITFSAGVAQWRVNESLDDLMKRADRALYEAKHGGKDRVTRAE